MLFVTWNVSWIIESHIYKEGRRQLIGRSILLEFLRCPWLGRGEAEVRLHPMSMQSEVKSLTMITYGYSNNKVMALKEQT